MNIENYVSESQFDQQLFLKSLEGSEFNLDQFDYMPLESSEAPLDLSFEDLLLLNQKPLEIPTETFQDIIDSPEFMGSCFYPDETYSLYFQERANVCCRRDRGERERERLERKIDEKKIKKESKIMQLKKCSSKNDEKNFHRYLTEICLKSLIGKKFYQQV